jgi:hypothetical protein
MSSSSSSTTSTTSTVVTALAAVVLARAAWAGVPEWAKDRLTGKAAASSSSSLEADANTDLTNPAVLLQKIKEVLCLAYELTDDLVPDDMPWHKLYCALQSMIHLMDEIDANHPEWRERYFSHDDTNTSIFGGGKDIGESELETLVEYLDYSDLAYNPSMAQVQADLKPKGYKLIRHDAAVEPGRVGHFLAVHYTKKRVLLGIKGTSTFSDVLTDIIGKAVPHPDYNEDFKCHEGIFVAAQMMLEETSHLLEHFFQEYEVIICGHSLGAGVSTLLGMFLKKQLPNLDLRVYAFATPACCSRDAALACQSYITSVVNNNDCVPRMSLMNLRTMHKLFMLVDQKLDEKGLSPKDFKTAKRYISDLMVIDSDLLLAPEELTSFLETEFQEEDADETFSDIQLFVPGKVVSVWNNTKDPSIIGSKVTTGVAKAFRQLFVEPNMLSDHACDKYRQNLTHLLEQTANTI